MEGNEDRKPSSDIENTMAALQELQQSLQERAGPSEDPFSHQQPSSVDELESAILSEAQTKSSSCSNIPELDISEAEMKMSYSGSGSSTADNFLDSSGDMHSSKHHSMQYVIVQDPIDLNSLDDFDNVQMPQSKPLSSLVNTSAVSPMKFPMEYEMDDEKSGIFSSISVLNIPKISKSYAAEEQEKVITRKEELFSKETENIQDIVFQDPQTNIEVSLNSPHSMKQHDQEEHSPRKENDTVNVKTEATDSETEDSSLQAQKDKATFSENLGLIPTIIKINQRTEQKYFARKGLSDCIGNADLFKERNLNRNEKKRNSSQKHEHSSNSKEFYKCGGCGKRFAMVCKLHDHLQDKCSTGSYHYDHVLKTAFPKHDTACSFSQTSDDSDDPSFDSSFTFPSVSNTVTNTQADEIKQKLNLKIKYGKKEKKTKLIDQPPKRKRGRPRKKQPEEVFTVKQEPEEPAVDINENLDGTLNEGSPSAFEFVSSVVARITQEVNNERAVLAKYANGEFPDQTDDSLLQFDYSTKGSGTKMNAKRTRKRKSTIPRKIVASDAIVPENDEEEPNNKIKVIEKHQCSFCEVAFSYKNDLLKHEMSSHSDQLKYDCDECNMRFVREADFARHKVFVHIEQREEDGIKKEPKKKGRRPLPRRFELCEFCSRKIPIARIEIHKRIHTGTIEH